MLKLYDPYFDTFWKKNKNKNKNKTEQHTHSHTHCNAMQNFQLIICQFYTVVDWIISLIIQ